MRAAHWVALLFAVSLGVPASRAIDNPYPYAADEPKAKALSLAKSAEYLDGVARFWMSTDSCGACHANYTYLMARPLLSGPSPSLVAQTRQFMARRKNSPNTLFTHNGIGFVGGKKSPPLSFFSPAERVGIAFAFVWQDRSAGKLQPGTRQALRDMWAKQEPGGYWPKMGCGAFPPLENDYYYPLPLAALAAGLAPEGYARTKEAEAGLSKLRGYLRKTQPPNLHHRAMLMWASLHVEGLMTADQREQTVKALLARQRHDGGWSLADLRLPKGGGTGSAPVSDGYGTAFTIFALRQAGVPPSMPEMVRGVRWLRGNQRASGRWFTPSVAAGDRTEGGVGTRDLYIQNVGTAFAVLALKACEEADDSAGRGTPRSLQGRAGLSLRGRLLVE